MSIAYRDAESFYCRCGRRYLWERESGWNTQDGDYARPAAIRDWYAPDSRPLTHCECGEELSRVRLAQVGKGGAW